MAYLLPHAFRDPCGKQMPQVVVVHQDLQKVVGVGQGLMPPLSGLANEVLDQPIQHEGAVPTILFAMLLFQDPDRVKECQHLNVTVKAVLGQFSAEEVVVERVAVERDHGHLPPVARGSVEEGPDLLLPQLSKVRQALVLDDLVVAMVPRKLPRSLRRHGLPGEGGPADSVQALAQEEAPGAKHDDLAGLLPLVVLMFRLSALIHASGFVKATR
mmetsp:Transcript_106685/g.311856  ORF Transcript_106685/g.311856 Transcript_106685/m.311856 type:complete len:214 (-) Transcript_106685:783-1424(-)